MNNIKPLLPLLSAALALNFIGSNLAAAEAETAGKPDAVIQHVDPQQAEKLLAEKKVVVLDIRTPAEFSSGRIAGAKNIDFQAPDFEQRIDRLDKSKTYLVHCASGGRSTRSLQLFKKLQFQTIYHLDGGVKAWSKAGLPLEK